MSIGSPFIPSPNLTEIPRRISIGTFQEEHDYTVCIEDFTARYSGKNPIHFTIGSTQLMVHGDIYLDLVSHQSVQRLIEVRQLGIAEKHKMFLCSNHRRYGHSLDTAIRMEITAFVNGADEKTRNLAIAAGLLHDLYMPPLSEHGRLGNREALDEEYHIDRILDDEQMLKTLEKHGVYPSEVIAVVRGEHPVLGKMLNSDQLDVDNISYTLIDSKYVTPENLDTEKFKLYPSDRVNYIHEDIIINNRGEPVFTEPYVLRDFLIRRAHLWANVYYSSANRANEVFLERELKKLWETNELTPDMVLGMNDTDFKAYIKTRIDPRIYKELFEIAYTDAFHEIAKIEDNADVEILQEWVKKHWGDQYDVIIKEQGGFKPATETLTIPTTDMCIKSPEVGRHSKYPGISHVPFSMAFPEEAKEINKLANDRSYLGVYVYKREGV